VLPISINKASIKLTLKSADKNRKEKSESKLVKKYLRNRSILSLERKKWSRDDGIAVVPGMKWINDWWSSKQLQLSTTVCVRCVYWCWTVHRRDKTGLESCDYNWRELQ